MTLELLSTGYAVPTKLYAFSLMVTEELRQDGVNHNVRVNNCLAGCW